MVVLCNDPAPSELYTLSLHDALPISQIDVGAGLLHEVHAAIEAGLQKFLGHLLAHEHLLFLIGVFVIGGQGGQLQRRDRKNTRLNSSHPSISYAVFRLKKKKTYVADD